MSRPNSASAYRSGNASHTLRLHSNDPAAAKPQTRQGEVTTIVETSRRIIIGALIAPYTEVLEEFARSHKGRHQQLFEVMVSKAQFFDILRRGICPAPPLANAADSVISDTAAHLFANNSSLTGSNPSPVTPSAGKLGTIALREYTDATILDDLEFIWSEITILLADGDDDDAGRMQRLKSKKFQSFKMGAKPASNGAMLLPTTLNIDSLQQNATIPDGNLVGDGTATFAVGTDIVESDHDSDDLAAVNTVDHLATVPNEDEGMAILVKKRLQAAGVEVRSEVPVKDLILRLSVASSPSPTITEDEAMHIISLLDEAYQRTNDEITRNAFMLLLKQNANDPQLKNVEMEELVLYLFPDDVNEVACLRQLIQRCQVSSNHHGFAVKYAEQRLRDWGDAKELFFYVPFLALYLCLVVSGKFLTPRSYYGYGATSAVSNTLYAPSFTSCAYDAETINECNDTKTVTATTLAGRIDWYYYMQQVFVPSVWTTATNSTTAAETVLGNDLRLVGAIKIRNIRVIGLENLESAEKYFGSASASSNSKQFPGYSRSLTDTSDHPNLLLNNTVFPSGSFVDGFDGLHYRTCDELNATGSMLGNIDTFSCDGHALVIPINTTQSQVLSLLSSLATAAWIDRQTRAVSTELLLFHPQSTMLVHAQMLVEFQPGGGLTTTTTIHPFTFATFSAVDSVFNALYIVFFVLLFFNIGRYVVWNYIRPMLLGGPARDFLRFRSHMVLDFLNYAMFLVSAISRLLWMRIGSPDDPVWLTTYYPDGFEDAATYYNTFVIIDGFNVMLSVVGLLRFGKFIPAMGIVVKALNNASKDAVALLLVIVGTFLSLVICAASVFGDSVLGYHSVLWAAETLGQAFIGNYDYTSLHDAHPTFSYVFFFVFQLTITVILLNMFIAVFTDAFNAAMESNFDRVTSTHILDNTAQHPFVRSNVWSMALGSMPVQSVKATINRVRKFFSCEAAGALDIDYFSYDVNLARSLRLLFATASIGVVTIKRGGKGSASSPHDAAGRRESSLHMSATIPSISTFSSEASLNISELLQMNLDKASLRAERIHATKLLAQLLDIVPLPRVQAASVSSAAALRVGANTKSKQGATNIYDYIHDQVGHDYALIMTFFVILPQTMFDQPGEYLLNRTMGVFVDWRDNVTQLSLKASEDVLLELRLRSVVQERQGHNFAAAAAAAAARRQSDDEHLNATAASMLNTYSVTAGIGAGKKDPAGVFLDKLDTFHRRLFLAILACSPIMEGAVLKERIRIEGDEAQGAPPASPQPSSPGVVEGNSRGGIVRQALELFIPARVVFAASPSPFRASKDLFLTHESFIKICQHSSVLQKYLAEAHEDYVSYMNYKHPSGQSSVASGSPAAAQPAPPQENGEGVPAAADGQGAAARRKRSQVAWGSISHSEHDTAPTKQHHYAPLLTVEKLASVFMVPEASAVRLEDFRFHIYEEFGEQALSFGLSIGETQRIEQYLEVRSQRHQRKAQKLQPSPNQLVEVGGGVILPRVFVEGSSDIPPVTGASSAGGVDDSVASPTGRGLRSPDDDDDALFVTLRGDEHLQDVAANDPASFYILEEREFDVAWKAAKRISPPDEVKDRIFSLFPTTSNGKRLVDMRMFLKFCRESVHAHKNKSFSRHYCEAEQQRFHSVVWILFYIPLFVVTLFFLFYQNPLGETIWVSEGLATSFAAPTSATSTGDIKDWMISCVKSIFPLPTEAATTHNNANYFVGTMRFRQHRVDPDDCSQQYLDYFGDPLSGTLRFPSSIGATERVLFTDRVIRDYTQLFDSQECYGAYNFGSLRSTRGFLRSSATVGFPEVTKAFTYQENSDSNDIDAFDSKYTSGGFTFDLNYTVEGTYANEAVSNLLAAKWIDNATRVVALEIIIFNFNIEVLARGRFGIELTSGGSYEPFRSVYVTRAGYPTDGLFRFFQVIFWLIVLLYTATVIVTYVTHIRSRIATYGENAAIAAVFGFFEDLGVPWDVVVIALMIASFTVRFYAAAGDSFNTVSNNGLWPTDVEVAVEWAKTLKQIEGVNAFMVFVRFLYFIGLNTRRFGIVIDTLRGSVVDLLSILALWIVALCACTLAAVICFGYGTKEAYNFQSAFFDLYNTASGGNPNYYDYTNSRRETAPVFWVLYFVVTFFVLYNMVVAVLTGKFADVKAQNFTFTTVNRVMLQEAGQEWFRRFGGWKDRFWSGFLIQETRRWWLVLRFAALSGGRRGTPLRLRCQNPRSCWAFMVETWRTLDMGIPVDVVEAAVNLIALELTVQQESSRWDHIRTNIDKQRVFSALGNTSLKFGAPPAAVQSGNNAHNKEHPMESEAEEGNASAAARRLDVAAASDASPLRDDNRDLPASAIDVDANGVLAFTGRVAHAVPELVTYADRRLPLWNEYIYYVFKAERDLVHRYLIGLPSHLLSWRQPKLWVHAVESAHYFNLLRSSYTVDLSESRVVQLTKILPNVDEIDAALVKYVTVDGEATRRL